MVYIVNREQVSEEPLLTRDAKSTKVRYLIDQRHGANNFYLRIYEIGPGGQTPHDQHPYEHEVYVLTDLSLRSPGSSSHRPSRCSV
ncbi:MAG: hypothetical protein E6K90_04380 [Thaumarchaeota archaeon]|nr:MAG: hypothetical protein E6K90_04380 [Nitrososphaerota archaeon]